MESLNAWVFPGQGSQFAGMTEASAGGTARAFDEATEILGWDVRAAGAADAADGVNATEVAQPLILTASVAAAHALRSRGRRPAFVAGHSVGEFAALVEAGVLSFPDALMAVATRGRAMAEAGRAAPGAMAAVLGLPEPNVHDLCAATEGVVVVANINAPQQIVISGERAAVERASESARRAGARRVIPLAVSVAAHSPLMAPARDALREALTSVAWSSPQTPFVSGVTAAFHNDPEQIAELLVQAVVAPVRWASAVATLAAAGAGTLIETGPGRVLTGLARRIDPELHAVPWDSVDSTHVVGAAS